MRVAVTHLPQLARHASVLIVDPGSPTERRRAGARSMAIVELGKRAIRGRLVELVP